MKLHYYPETDSLYVEFKAGPGVETREVSDGLNVDLDAAGDVSRFRYRPCVPPPRSLDAGDRSAAVALHQGRLIRGA